MMQIYIIVLTLLGYLYTVNSNGLRPISNSNFQHKLRISSNHNEINRVPYYDDLQSLCDIAAGTNLGKLFPGNWSCGIHDLNRWVACKWNGISCNRNGSIISLNLPSCGVRGSLPSSIGYLSVLTSLSLNKNFLVSSIPTTIGFLTKLQALVLNSNSFTNAIPTSIGYLTALTVLWLRLNFLTSSIPSSIGQLAVMKSLRIGNNKLTSTIPTALGFLTAMTRLALPHNLLRSTIPTTIGYLTSLEQIVMSFNSISGAIPTSLGYLTALTSLWMYNNKLTSSIPTTIGYLTALLYLSLYSNFLSSVIPSSIGQLSVLVSLGLHNNELMSSIPTSIGLLSRLVYCGLNYNKLTGYIPTSLQGLTNLQYLYLDNNYLQGTITSKIGLLSKLVFIGLGYNQINGTIPSTFGRLNALMFLDLNDNDLSSTVPSELSLLSKLIGVTLENNMFTGAFPVEICKITMGYISMRNNKFTCIPWCQDDFDWTGTALSLPRCQDHQDQALFDFQNTLGVSLALQSQASLETATRIIQSPHPCLAYSSHINDTNAFEYVVEMSVFDMNGYLLFCLDFACRTILGKYGSKGWIIPAHTNFLLIQHSAFYIKFSYDYTACVLVGTVYECFTSFGFKMTLTSRLRYLMGWEFISSASLPYISKTLSPPSVYASGLCQVAWKGVTCEKGLVVGLALSGIGLQGSLPSSIGLLTALTALDLSGNLIGGSILSSIGLLSNLAALSLNQNSLTGSIPSSFMNMTRLYVASISNNGLSGSVPTLLYSIDNLHYLYLEGNNFYGEVTDDFCHQISKRNVTTNLKNIPSLTCYQDLCLKVLNQNLNLDPSLKMCAPTLSPTTTRIPTLAPSFKPSTTVLVVKPLLDENQTIAVSICASVVVLALIAFIVYKQFFSKRAIHKKIVSRRLDELPVHRFLHNLPNHPTDAVKVEEELLSTISIHIDTVNQKDIDGKTALGIILADKKNVSELVVYTLLKECLPVNVISGFEIEDTALFAGWTDAVQSEADNVVAAVHRILDEYKKYIKILTNARDSAGRKCIELACKRSKDRMCRLMYLHERYDIHEGPPVHKSDTSLVVFALDYGEENSVPNFPQQSQLRERSNKDLLSPEMQRQPFNRSSTRSAMMRASNSLRNLIQGGRRDSFEEVSVMPTRRVALKLMKNRDQFQREVDIRDQGRFDKKFVVSMITVYGDDDDDDMKFRRDAELKGYGEYPFCIVMEAANHDLKHIVDHEHCAGIDWTVIRDMTRSLAGALHHLHHKGIVHGDLKPLNILQVKMALKLTDLDASANFTKGDNAGSKISSGYIPPEMLWLDDDDDEVRVRAELKIHKRASVDLQRAIEIDLNFNGACIKADPSQDMWSLGCVLYYLCTGTTLFKVNAEDNIISQDEFQSLYDWTVESMNAKLSIVTENLARNLLSLLLSKDPTKRPTAMRVLGHPFLTGKRGVRLQGEQALWDVFLSYRVASDSKLVEVIYQALTALGLKVWWDRVCLLPGQNWEDGFCKGLVSSANFVCLASRGAIKDPDVDKRNWEKLVEASECDNVLLEWRIALELMERGMIYGVFPVMIGDEDLSGVYTKYFPSKCHPSPPDVVVASVEMKVREHLDREGLGMPYKESMTARAVLNAVFMNQGGSIQGDLQSSVDGIAKTVLVMTKTQSRISITPATSPLKQPKSPVKGDENGLQKGSVDASSRDSSESRGSDREITELRQFYEESQQEKDREIAELKLALQGLREMLDKTVISDTKKSGV